MSFESDKAQFAQYLYSQMENEAFATFIGSFLRSKSHTTTKLPYHDIVDWKNLAFGSLLETSNDPTLVESVGTLFELIDLLVNEGIHITWIFKIFEQCLQNISGNRLVQ